MVDLQVDKQGREILAAWWRSPRAGDRDKELVKDVFATVRAETWRTRWYWTSDQANQEIIVIQPREGLHIFLRDWGDCLDFISIVDSAETDIRPPAGSPGRTHLTLATDLHDTLWKLEPHTAAKHELYRRYVDAWWAIMLQAAPAGRPWDQITYIDAFAGPGEYLGGDPGSPVIALESLLMHRFLKQMNPTPRRVHLLLTENRSDRAGHLRAVLTHRFGPLDLLPVTITIRQAEAGAGTLELLNETGGRGYPVLAVFDSWGNVNVPHAVICQLARNPASEIIVTFGPNWFSRREELEPDKLDLVFGGRRYWEPANRESGTDERWRAWLGTYREALGRAGFRYRLQFEIVPRTGQPLYLVHGTKHAKGVEVMKKAMWDVDGNDGMGFRDPRTRGAPLPGQLTIWSASDFPQDELLDLAVQKLEAGAVSLGELGEWLLTETSRWRRPDAAKAVRQLVRDGRATVPPGRLTSKSIVRLR
jgi:three-Cys-motif partner protein